MAEVREIPAEDSIKVVCRFRPLNDSEEKAGSKFIVKFPQGSEENCVSISVSELVDVLCKLNRDRIWRNSWILIFRMKKKKIVSWLTEIGQTIRTERSLNY